MTDERETLIFTPEDGVPLATALETLRHNGVEKLTSLEEVGLIIGTAPTSHLAALRALPEFRTVDPDQPVHIAREISP